MTIPFDPSRGLVEVAVTLDGHIKGVFGIDTGADRLYIDRGFALRNNLSFANAALPDKVTGIDGTTTASFVSLRSLEVGSELLVNERAMAIDMAQLAKEGKDEVPDGLIGYEVLQQFFVTVDYPARTLELTRDLPRFIYGNSYYTVPFSQHQHLVLVQVDLPGDIRVPMILDYCASYTSLSTELAGRLNVAPDSRGLAVVERITLGEKVISEKVPVAVVDFDQYRRSVPRAEFEGILGASFLKDHRITVDYRTKQIYVRKP
jgi:hypothetical protein